MNFNPIFPKQSIPTASVEISQGKVYAISREYNFSVPVEEYRSSDNGPRKKDLLGIYKWRRRRLSENSLKDRIITVTYNDKSVEIPLVAPLKDETTWMYNFGLAPKKAGEEFIEMIVSDLKLEY